MADPIRLQKFEDRVRVVSGRKRLPERDQQRHGAYLNRQLNAAVAQFEGRLEARPAGLPDVPEGIQVLIKGATTASGRSLLESAKLKGLKLEVLEERGDGVVIALSRDPSLGRLAQAVDDFRTDAHTRPTAKRPHGTRKPGIIAIFGVDDLEVTPRELRIGPELLEVRIDAHETYLVDIEIAAGADLADEGAARRDQFGNYLRDGHAAIVGNGPIIEEDYTLYRAHVPGTLLEDLLDRHVWVKFVDRPPQVEREAIALRNIEAPQLPPIEAPAADSSPICVIDSGVVTQHPLLRDATADGPHRSYIPGDAGTGDAGNEGHGTAVSGVAAWGDLRRSILNGGAAIKPVRVIASKILDDRAILPDNVNLKEVLPRIIREGKDAGALIFNHSIASRAQFNRTRMSVWAEALDRSIFDEGGEGCLVVVCTGNIDGFRPTLAQLDAEMRRDGHPGYLAGEDYRLRNPAQAINALTVGAYSRNSLAGFRGRALGHRPISAVDTPSPFTRSGYGYLGEVKPEVVEEGGNWYRDNAGVLVADADLTDVPLLAHDYATSGRLVKFGSATSWAAPRVAHLAARAQEQLGIANADLLRALIVNSARWPTDAGSVEQRLRTLGYGVPDPDRILVIGQSRCSILIEDSIRIGNAQFFRIPWPSELFEQQPDIEIRVSITLAYRAPVRKSSRKYRGTILEWKFSKRGESFQDFYDRSIYQGVAAGGEEEAEEPEDAAAAVGDWPWVVKTNQRKRGTVQKDWFDAPSSYFGDEMFFSVIGRRGWLSKERQDAGFQQSYAAVVTIEVVGQQVPIHERIEALVAVPIPAERIRVRA